MPFLDDSITAPVAGKLSQLMGKPVTFLNDCVGDEVQRVCSNPVVGGVFVLENMRFYKEEGRKGG